MKIDILNTTKKYSIIYADPPWAYLWGTGKTGGNFCPEKHYKTMSVDEICALGQFVRKLRDKNCALFIWTTTALQKNPAEIDFSFTRKEAENGSG